MATLGHQRILVHSAPKQKSYQSNSVAVSGNDGYVCATLAVEGLSDGTEERLLVHSDYFGRSGIEGRAGSGREGALLDWTALGNGAGATIKTLERNMLWNCIGVHPVAAQATMLAAIERYFMLSMRVLLDRILKRMR